MSTTPARPMGLLYGPPNNLPAPNMNWLQAPGCAYVQNRTQQANRAWLQALRAAGGEALYYTNLVEYPIAWVPSEEEAHLYGDFGSWTNVPDSWWWTGSRATASARVNYGGHYMLNVRVGSPWWTWVLDTWAPAFFSRNNGVYDGHFLDVAGNRLWVAVWNTMCATVDAYAGDGRKEAENWIRGMHWGIAQLRTRFGPEVILVANNTWETRGLGSGMPNLPDISGAQASMAAGGHPALNGCMFEGCDGGATTGQHPVNRVTADIAGSSTTGAPEGHVWATQAGGRKRFMAISSKASANMAAYVNVPYLWVGWMPSGYESSAQSQVSGTVRTALDDHLQGWTWTAPGGGGDVTPPLAPTAFSAGPASGSSVPVSYTLPTDADRNTFKIARKQTSWGASENPDAGTLVLSVTPGAAGAGSLTDGPGVPDGPWYYKPFTIDAAGNVNRSSAEILVTVATASQVTPDAYLEHTFTGSAGAKPDGAVWSDPDLRTTGYVAGSSMRVDGAGRLSITALTAVQGAWGAAVMQRLVQLDIGRSARRDLLVEQAAEGPALGSASFYLLGASGTIDGNGLAAPYAHPNWLRFEQIGQTFRVVRKVEGAVTTLYSGTLPAVPVGTMRAIRVLIGAIDLAVMVDGVLVLPLTARVPAFGATFGSAYLYLEAATNDAAVPLVARWGRILLERATPAQPSAPALSVGAGDTVYTAEVPPAEDLVTGWSFYRDGVLVNPAPAPGRVLTVTGELPPGEYDVQVGTGNGSPWDEGAL